MSRHARRLVTSSVLFGLLSAAPRLALAVDSVKLTDVVKSTGSGSIDLLKDVSPAALEAFRQDHGGALVLAVDVNENAEGSEKASCQGVALASVVLRVAGAGFDETYTAFTTQTKALLAPLGSTQRATYFTSIGNAGSNRITSNAIQAEFDSTLVIPVGRALSTVSTATVDIRFLDTNVALGDPETFYDYTNGFEDLALVNASDATFLDTLAAGRSEAPSVVLTNPPPATSPTVTSWISAPSAAGYYTVGYEDLFPNRGDYDFNDLLVSYRVELGLDASGNVLQLKGVALPVARGAGLSHAWHLRVRTGSATTTGTLVVTRKASPTAPENVSSVTFQGDVDIEAIPSSRAAMPPPPGWAYTNTEPGSPFVQGARTDFVVVFDTPLSLSALQDAPFDPYLAILPSGLEIHLPGQPASAGSPNIGLGLTSFTDPAGFPFAILVPTEWSYPYEEVDLGIAYPALVDYVTSRGTRSSNWYALPSAPMCRAVARTDWEWGYH